jgi:hypothetical protein
MSASVVVVIEPQVQTVQVGVQGPPGAAGATGATGATGTPGVVTASLPLSYNSGTQALSVVNTVNAQTGTTYTLVAADKGKIVTLSNASTITLTVPSGLGADFSCILLQLGAGQVTVTGSGATINNRQSHTKIAGQYGFATLFARAANTFILGGDTST